jgi:hypothetical protein
VAGHSPAAVVFVGTLLSGCSGVFSAGDLLPEFALEDVNATSDRHGESVSPRDYLEVGSAWYFGHAT